VESLSLFDEPPPDAAVPCPPRVRVRVDLAYHGARFHGFAENPGVRTVAGVLRVALEKVLGHTVELTGAGRTDRGVHARGQVVSFAADPARLDPGRLLSALNGLCGPEIAVSSVRVVEDGFDARHSAVARCYRYTVLNRPTPDPLLADRAWHVPEPISLPALRLASDPLLGEHDFSSFCRRPKGAPDASLVRHLSRLDWREAGDDLLVATVEADAFCHQMVRSLVGLAVAVGTGVLRAGDVHGVLAARDRNAVPRVAPAHGLVLESVTYPTAG
jgi:tRNA pseudouridine38-40 synthase